MNRRICSVILGLASAPIWMAACGSSSTRGDSTGSGKLVGEYDLGE